MLLAVLAVKAAMSAMMSIVFSLGLGNWDYLDLLALYKRLPMFMRIKIGIRGMVCSPVDGVVIDFVDVAQRQPLEP